MTRDPYASLKHGLVGAWIPSISGSGLLLPDLSMRGNNGSLVNMDASDWVGSGTGRALDFDGTLDHVNLGANHNFTGAFSLSIWANLRNKTGYKLILAKSDYGSTPNKREFLFYVSGTDLTPTDSLAFLIMNPTSFANRIGRSLPNASIPLDQFTNFICTYTGNGANSGIAIYINGVRSDTTDQGLGTFTGVVTQTTPLAIGTDFNNFPTLGNQADMISDDIRIYSRALTEAEIKLLASDRGIGFKRRASSTFAKRYTYQPPKAKVYEGVRVRDHDYASLRQGLVGAWCPSLPNGGSGNILPDQSGRGNNGTLVGMGPEDWVASGSGRALDFDGVNDFVEVPFKFNSTGVISFWYRGTAEPGTAVYLGDKSNTGTEIYLGQNVTGSLSNELITFSNDAGAVNTLYGYTTATRTELFDGAWHHVVVVLRQVNTAPEIYLDGNSKAVTLGNNSLAAWSIGSASGTTLQFGAQNFSNTNSAFLTGQLDDIRIYNRALTESEIRLLASKRGIGLQPSPTRFIAKEKKTGLRRRILTGQT